jgi:hypothetical protein
LAVYFLIGTLVPYGVSWRGVVETEIIDEINISRYICLEILRKPTENGTEQPLPWPILESDASRIQI